MGLEAALRKHSKLLLNFWREKAAMGQLASRK
jgi:hypothetical protein